MKRPWGIQAIGDIYYPDVKQETPDGRWVAAVAVPYPCNWREAIRAAWWVLTGRAVAFMWPRAGDLENIFIRRVEDARLISAAPDMLAALKAVDAMWSQDAYAFEAEMGFDTPVGRCWRAIRAAIAKATGRDV